MLKILIVEDEFLIRLGLKTTLNWEQHGYFIVGEASNGEDAIAMVRACQPDVVMTDIEMPKMNGIELIAALKKEYPNLVYIILTNYSSFEYAQEAIRLGVSRYILKSEITEQTLLASLEGIDRNHKATQTVPSGTDFRTDYLKNLVVRGNMNRCKLYATRRPPDPGLFQDPAYMVVVYTCDISSLQEKSLEMLSKILSELLEAAYPGVVDYTTTRRTFFYYVGIVPVEPGDENRSGFADKSRSIREKLRRYFPLTLLGGCSTCQSDQAIPRMLYEAEQARQRCFFTEERFLAFTSEMDGEQEQAVSINAQRIVEYISAKDADALKAYLHEIMQTVWNTRSMGSVEHGFVDLIMIARNYCQEANVQQSMALRSKWDYTMWEDLMGIRAVEDYLWNVYALVMATEGNKESRYSGLVQKCIKYIRQHYTENMSLEDAAAEVAVSKGYLSVLFKQETGVNFVSYLNHYRIEKSKELILNTDLKIYEIALRVGYESPYYFSKLFKEIVGTGCKEYRSLHHHGAEAANRDPLLRL